MFKGYSLAVISRLIVVLVMFFLPLSAQAQETYKFRIQTVVPNASIFFKLMSGFAEKIETMSDGRLQADVLPAGAIVKPFEVQDAVDKGVVKAGWSWPNYWSGKSPAYALFNSAPASTGMDQRTFMAWYYRGEGQALYEKLNREIMGLNIHSFLFMPHGPSPLGWFNEQVQNMEQLRSTKFRVPPGIPGKTYAGMGIPTVAIPGGQIVPAAQRGVIDAAEWIAPADDRNLGLDKVWNNYYLDGFHQQSNVAELLVNQDFWDSLPKDLQAIMNTAVLALSTEMFNATVYDNSRAVRKFQDEGINLPDTPEGYYKAFIESQRKVMSEYSADKSDFFRTVLQSQIDFASSVYPYWSRVQKLYSRLIETAHEAKQAEGK